MFKILQKFLPEIINLLLTFYLQARQLNNRGFPLDFLNFLNLMTNDIHSNLQLGEQWKFSTKLIKSDMRFILNQLNMMQTETQQIYKKTILLRI